MPDEDKTILKAIAKLEAARTVIDRNIADLRAILQQCAKARTAQEAQAREVAVEELELSTRLQHVLKANNLKTVGELADMGRARLLSLPNVGRITVTEAKEVLACIGLTLAK